ncbi:right-handed parallel beta-helix repeat-containing protein [Rhodopirellula sp. JC639]|uniref:right-handed parallel beta-helix repeat-containing protein n=1 Tax=Stieleria mannarensis TaxID=2755585 RepID=UPI0015FF0FC2|nr:right-handed parallel beta-helix repeat-containing protein [Rhodopirellula sp. JC639]
MVLVALGWTTTVWTRTVHAANYYVRKTGNDSNLGTNRNQAFRTLTKATSVAGQGDILFVGAGTYDENVVINGSGSNAAGWFVLYADRTGIYTGDKGDVIVRPATRTWTVRVFNTGNILFFGFAFEGNPAIDDRNYGCLVTNTAGSAYYLNCNFHRLTYALRDLGTHRLFASGCKFQRVRYGIYTSGIQSTNVINCQFAATQYGCIGYDGSGVSVTRSRFTDRVDANDPATSTRGVYAARTALAVSRCDFSGSTVGVYGTALKQAAITRCNFLETTSHAVRCDGESLSISRCSVKDGHYGVTLGDTTGKSATLSDLDIESMRVGITAHQGDYDFRNVTLRGNKYALYQRSGNKRLTLSKQDRIDFIDNDFAIYTNHAKGEDADLILSDRDLSGNARGLVSYRTRVSVDNCTFGGTSMGAYVSDSQSVRISDSTFGGNPADPKSCAYGLYARSDQIDVQRCSFINSRYGITIHNTSDNPPLLRNLISENHTAAALYLRNGTWTYTDADNNVFRGAPRGVMANAVTWSIRDVTTSETCQYPIIDYYGECSIADTTAKGTTTGFYAYRSKAIDITNLTVSGCGSYGVRINDCTNVRIGKSTSRGNGHGAYVYSKQNAIPEIRDCDFSGNTGYGLLMTGTTITPASAGNLQLNRNRYGLRVNNQPLTLTPAMNVQVTGNQYGVLCQNDQLTLTGIELVGNDVGAYCSRGRLSIEQCNVAATNYGVLGYLDGACEIAESKFNDAAYGIYLRSVGTQGSPIRISKSRVVGATRCGVYVRGDPANQTAVQIRDCSIRNGRQGLVYRDAVVTSDNVHFADLSSTGVYQAGGSGTIHRCTFTRLTGSWGILARGARCDISQSSILAGRYGIAMQSAQGSVTNCVIAGTDYGIHLRGADAMYSIVQTTVAAAKFFGLIRYSGDTTVRNSIFDVTYYGLYNANPDGVFDHQYNLVHASRRPYTNSGPGIGEVNDPPQFVDPGGGDFHLAMGSPAINSGLDLSGLVSIDLDGNPRPSFQGYEMGAYEFMEPSGSIRVLNWDEVAH